MLQHVVTRYEPWVLHAGREETRDAERSTAQNSLPFSCHILWLSIPDEIEPQIPDGQRLPPTSTNCPGCRQQAVAWAAEVLPAPGNDTARLGSAWVGLQTGHHLDVQSR